MPTLNLLYRHDIRINDNIHVVIPKVGDILDNEDEYYGMVSMLTAMPVDLMAQLDEIGIDFETINEYELFLMMFPVLQTRDTSMVFGDMSLKDFVTAENTKNGMIVLHDPNTGIVIDRSIHGQIAAALRKIHGFEKNQRMPANPEAKNYMLQRARAKMRRRKRNEESQLESLIISVVCTEQYKYDFEGTRELSIYQFNECVRQIISKIDYDHRMAGVYAGTIDPKGLSQDDLSWLAHKSK